MATVTGMTSTRMLAIEAATVVGGSIDSAGHLILTKKDGTQVDAGPYRDASTTVKGVVELATSAETQTGTDAVRAVTPAGLASIPGTRVQNITPAILETALPSAYPTGISIMNSGGTTPAWSLNGGLGTVVTNNSSIDRCEQTYYSNAGGTSFLRAWVRSYHTSNGGGGWTLWADHMIMVNLDPTAFTQTTPLTSYPQGSSRIYFTPTNSAGWDFAGDYSEMVTYRDGSDFARQRWTLHTNSGGQLLRVMERTANSSASWSAWVSILIAPQGGWISYTPTWTAATTNPVVGNGTLIGRYSRVGRTINVHINLAPGSTTTFGTGGNYSFALPFPVASNGASFVGNAQFLGANRWGGQLVLASSGATASPFLTASSTNPQLVWMGGSAPEPFASGHQLRMTGVYEAAS